jgi:hypothetical protein
MWTVALITALFGSAGCAGEGAAQNGAVSASHQAQFETAGPPVPRIATPASENPADRIIRRDLDEAIAQDPGLKEREISFSVDNGDITVTGTVRTEEEREKINELGMGVRGVRSVANALRVSP